MNRRAFLKRVATAGAAQLLGTYTLFPRAIHAKIPADLKVTGLKVIRCGPVR